MWLKRIAWLPVCTSGHAKRRELLHMWAYLVTHMSSISGTIRGEGGIPRSVHARLPFRKGRKKDTPEKMPPPQMPRVEELEYWSNGEKVMTREKYVTPLQDTITISAELYERVSPRLHAGSKSSYFTRAEVLLHFLLRRLPPQRPPHTNLPRPGHLVYSGMRIFGK